MSVFSLPSPGDVIGGKYRVDSLTARGGMAAIFSGQHLVLGQRIAIKVMLADGAREEATVERFLREAQAAARLESEHVTRVIDAGLLDDGLPFLIMEFLEGSDLGAKLASHGPPPVTDVVDWMMESLEGLAHVHAAGIVHRDLKPSNLFLAQRADGSAVVKLLDFGVSKSLVEPEDDRVKALTGNRVIGSPVYMSPEQVRSARSVDVRSDIWSMGVTLYELITGQIPFDGEGVGEVLARVLDPEATAEPMRSRRADVPEGLDRVVARCFERTRSDRYADVGEMARALAPFGSRNDAERVARIEAMLVNAPLLRAPTSLGSIAVVRATTVERAANVVVPPGLRRDGSGDFALSRTFADASRISPSSKSVRRRRFAWAGAASAIVAIATLVGVVHRAPQDLPVVQAVAMAQAPVATERAQVAPADTPSAAASASVTVPATERPSRAKAPHHAGPPTLRPAFLKSRK